MKSEILLFAMGALILGGCTQQKVAAGAVALVTYTKPEEKPPAETKSQIPAHETWCYTTMGDTECYAKAQDVQPGRLVNVEPQNLYPLTEEAYNDEIQGRRAAPATEKPVKLDEAGKPPKEEKSFFDKLKDYVNF